MLIHDEPVYTIYFGDAEDHMYPQHYAQWRYSNLFAQPQIRSMARRLQLDRLTFLSQVHGKDGLFITQRNVQDIRPFSVEGDFLITNNVRIGLGIMTADCLPVICYDKRHHVAGIAHAGWRGAVAGVVTSMLHMMRDQCGTQRQDITVFYGPSAKRCCYQVGDLFGKNLEQYHFADDVLYRYEGALYFDLPGFIKQQLLLYGLKDYQFRIDYNNCTICDHRFCSYRRETGVNGDSRVVGRQMTVVVLK